MVVKDDHILCYVEIEDDGEEGVYQYTKNRRPDYDPTTKNKSKGTRK